MPGFGANVRTLVVCFLRFPLMIFSRSRSYHALLAQLVKVRRHYPLAISKTEIVVACSEAGYHE